MNLRLIDDIDIYRLLYDRVFTPIQRDSPRRLLHATLLPADGEPGQSTAEARPGIAPIRGAPIESIIMHTVSLHHAAGPDHPPAVQRRGKSGAATATFVPPGNPPHRAPDGSRYTPGFRTAPVT